MTNGRHQHRKLPDDRDRLLASRTGMRRAGGIGSRRALVVATAIGLGAIATGISLVAFSSPSGQTGHNVVAGHGSPAAAARSAQPTPPPVASSATGPNVTSAGISKTALQYPSELK